MNNHEYVKLRFIGTSMTFSETARLVFEERNAAKPFSRGDIVDWLDRPADTALDFPVGTLIQWDEDSTTREDPNHCRNSIYGCVKELLGDSEDVLDGMVITAVDSHGRTVDRYIRVSANRVRRADIPTEIIKIAQGAGNKI